MMIKEFIIAPEYLTDVTIRKDHSVKKSFGEATDDDLIKTLKGQGECYSISSEDHPEFAALRNQLEAEGYIQTERQWWNGDRVSKRFRLNGVLFDREEQFPCAMAMAGHLKFAKKYQLKKGGSDAQRILNS
jgi:competence protein ComGC